MDRLQFFMPVRLVAGSDEIVTEIYSVDQALDFLQAWPVGRQGPVYRTTLKACTAAMIDQVTAEDARRSFMAFSRMTGLLSRDATIPPAPDPDAWMRPAAK
ncbi:DUF982 domain-containing protein [Mesorhizobium sp. CGMCC 1.15528]|uniref:DUF982 domain-containing protein n=1 Tax=Mesorhizobium zhangyense TaxID=1776730 RepID=A0A7C9R977_9HYPH|nr:DUF982 domain-containing protein [Mesorhizobium zhangyense]NGN42939.1 DUF982 domain-containing protein [Mesorhizobium zhangyense]